MLEAPSPDIFISYPGGSIEDSRNVLALGRALEDRGLRPWIGEREHPRLDDEAKQTTIEMLDMTPVFISCLGRREIQEWGREEVARAANRTDWDPDFRTCTVLLPGTRAGRLDRQPAALKGDVFDLRAGLDEIGPLIAFCLDGPPDFGWLVANVVDVCRNGPGTVLLTGPRGSGKSSIARAAMSELAGDFPAGQAMISVANMDPEQALEAVRVWLAGKEASAGELEESRYLIVFDDADLEDASALISPGPSAAIVVSSGVPRISAHHVKIDTEVRRHAMRTELREVRPGYTSDSPGGVDLLDLERPVQALCSVIAAKDVQPPLSIGLFGEWGAGKTFFIEQMRQRIDDIAGASRDTDDSAYCSSIKQIVFNAWHYSDANLWASIAGRVFEGLGAADEGRARRLYKALESSQLQLQQAETEERAAAERADRAKSEEERARQAIAAARVQLADLGSAAADILATIDSKDPLLGELAKVLGQEEPIDPAAARDLLTLRGSFGQLFKRARWTFIGLVALLGVLAALLVFLPDAAALGVTLLSALALALRLLGGPIRWIGNAREKARERAEALHRNRHAELEERLELFRQQEREARRRHEEARRQAEQAQHEIDRVENGDKLFEFIAERSQASAYAAYQGVVALVRRDFEVLGELIAEHTHEDNGLPRIQRIVLYIDDLDRCPAPRVVEVLEAVHLLMASELFVVVVAVDPRWLLSSLRRRYADEMNVGDEGLWAPTPEDYMEKIFQVPFSLPRMEDDGYRRLIRSLIPSVWDGDGVAETDPDSAAETPGEEAVGGDPPQLALPTRPTKLKPEIELRPEGLRITGAEIDFLSRLRSLARTPRSAKRLANLYRLVRATLSTPELDDLLEARPPQFGCVQLLLGIVVGFPAVVPPLYDELGLDPRTGSWWEFVDDWEPPYDDGSWQRLLDAMEPLRDEPLPDLRIFSKWVPLVARYSYGALPVRQPSGDAQ